VPGVARELHEDAYFVDGIALYRLAAVLEDGRVVLENAYKPDERKVVDVTELDGMEPVLRGVA
jgi:hypothetical protein